MTLLQSRCYPIHFSSRWNSIEFPEKMNCTITLKPKDSYCCSSMRSSGTVLEICVANRLLFVWMDTCRDIRVELRRRSLFCELAADGIIRSKNVEMGSKVLDSDSAGGVGEDDGELLVWKRSVNLWYKVSKPLSIFSVRDMNGVQSRTRRNAFFSLDVVFLASCLFVKHPDG